MTRAAIIVNSALGRMQVRRLTEESGMRNVQFFLDEASANEWLAAPPGGTER